MPGSSSLWRPSLCAELRSRTGRGRGCRQVIRSPARAAGLSSRADLPSARKLPVKHAATSASTSAPVRSRPRCAGGLGSRHEDRHAVLLPQRGCERQRGALRSRRVAPQNGRVPARRGTFAGSPRLRRDDRKQLPRSRQKFMWERRSSVKPLPNKRRLLPRLRRRCYDHPARRDQPWARGGLSRAAAAPAGYAGALRPAAGNTRPGTAARSGACPPAPRARAGQTASRRSPPGQG
jgi:hypothetical protein